ncbi:ABC transporter permease, partial [Streptomyces sp. SID11233]|nr:ABC transporter permease [Streptomyces sp. SID11233]
EQRQQIETDLKKMPAVQTVAHETADQAYKLYQKEFSRSPIASQLTPDLMPESFRVKLKDPKDYDVIATAFKGRAGVQSVQDQKS